MDGAAKGDPTAQYNVGQMYENGEDVPQSYTKAMVWYMKAASQRNASAQNSIGVLHRDGKDIPQDYSTAKEWFFRAADQGHAEAQFNLGMLYHQENNRPKALGWFMEAAEQGHTIAQFSVGQCTTMARPFLRTIIQLQSGTRKPQAKDTPMLSLIWAPYFNMEEAFMTTPRL